MPASTLEVADALLTEEREEYAAYLLAWSRNPHDSLPLTFEEWRNDHD